MISIFLKSATRITPAAARVIPFATFIFFIVLESLAGEWLRSQGLDTRWLYCIRAITVGFLLLVLWRHYTELHDYSGITGWQIVVASVTGLFVFVLWINLDFSWATVGQPATFDPTVSQGQGLDWTLVFFRLLGLAIIVPIMEELFWRSYLLRRVDAHDFLAHAPRKASIYAIMICAALFASEHHQWLAGLFAGLAYTLVYIHSCNLWLPIISHTITNAALGCWILVTGQWRFW
jgi:CAAX prenyl protease-like protein